MYDRDRPNPTQADAPRPAAPSGSPAAATPAAAPGAEDEAATPSPAVLRFQSCRWRKPASGEIPAHCGHPEVLPFAGAHGFSADSWCPDCQFYKLRRTPTRRDDY